MKVQELSGSEVLWNSYDENGKKWFSAEIDLMGFDVVETTDPDIGKYLRKLFKACCQKQWRIPISLEKIQGRSLSRISTQLGTGLLFHFDLQHGCLGRCQSISSLF